MLHRAIGVSVLSLLLATVPVAAATRAAPTPGSPGIGDDYYPLDGNGGYDVRHYDLRLRYDPYTGLLGGQAKLRATSTQALSAFDLDLVGLTVRSVTVDGRPATWTREGQELQVVPARPLRRHQRFAVEVRYDGVPERLDGAGFIATDDGFDIAGQPHVAASWFPVDDHPTDKASYTFRVTVPESRQVLANGRLVGRHPADPGWTTWTWRAPDPMASYLATVDVGRFDVTSYRRDGLRFVDGIDPDLFDPVARPSTGTHFAVSQQANGSYKRLTHTLDVPAGGAGVGFTITRDTEQDWDYAFVEVHTVGSDDWTTLEDLNGHTSQDTGQSCTGWPDVQPFLSSHYLTVDQGAGTCTPTGATGQWWAASGASDGPEQWQVDLGAYSGRSVELSISYASDPEVQNKGVFVDDVVVSTGQGSTSFENGLDGWTVPGAPAGSPGNDNDWTVGTVADLPPSEGSIAAGSFAREPEIIAFLAGQFGPYPWRSVGGIVDDVRGLGFALETQTRPVYARDFFTDPLSGDDVVVHELAHQWYGDSLAVHRWRDIWLNEGFATYAEWLWFEHEGLSTPQEQFDFFYSGFIPDDHPWWQLTIGDPGPDQLFEYPVYFRGAMTLQQLRLAVGDDDFFRILRRWAASRAGGNVSTPEFIRLAERISGKDLDALFQAWLFTPGKPALPAAEARRMPRHVAVPAGVEAALARARLAAATRR